MVNNWELPPTQKAVGEIAPIFVKYVKELFFNDIGFGEEVTICDVKSSYKPQSFDAVVESRGDRFQVVMAYAGRLIKWEVIFNWYKPEFAPDFLFSDDFMQKLDIMILRADDFMPSWANWDHNEPKSLVYVLRELMELYKSHQVSLLEDDTRVKTEYQQLLSEAKLVVSDVEVLKGAGDSTRKARPTEKKAAWSFLVRLPVKFTEELDTDTPTGTQEDVEDARVMLFFDFSNSGDSRPTTDMRYSPRGLELLKSVGVPNLTRLSGMPVHAAVTKAAAAVKEAVARKYTARRQRAEFLSALVLKLQPGLVEMDTQKFLSASFLIEQGDFHGLMSVSLSLDYPAKKPQVHLRSIYLMGSDGQPLSKVMEDFPYASSWKPIQKAERIVRYCIESLSEFQDDSTAADLADVETSNSQET